MKSINYEIHPFRENGKIELLKMALRVEAHGVEDITATYFTSVLQTFAVCRENFSGSVWSLKFHDFTRLLPIST